MTAAAQRLIAALTEGPTTRHNRFEQALRALGPGVEVEPYGIAITYQGETLRVSGNVWHNVRELFESIPLAFTGAQAAGHFYRTLAAAETVHDARMMAAEARARKHTAEALQRQFAADLTYCIHLSRPARC